MEYTRLFFTAILIAVMIVYVTKDEDTKTNN